MLLAATAQDARDLALVAVIAVAPIAVIVIVGMLRGYTMKVEFYRDRNGANGRR